MFSAFGFNEYLLTMIEDGASSKNNFFALISLKASNSPLGKYIDLNSED